MDSVGILNQNGKEFLFVVPVEGDHRAPDLQLLFHKDLAPFIKDVHILLTSAHSQV